MIEGIRGDGPSWDVAGSVDSMVMLLSAIMKTMGVYLKRALLFLRQVM